MKNYLNIIRIKPFHPTPRKLCTAAAAVSLPWRVSAVAAPTQAPRQVGEASGRNTKHYEGESSLIEKKKEVLRNET